MSNKHKCPIWETPATITTGSRDGKNVNSSRAGGEYFISGSAHTLLATVTEQEKTLLTSWLVKQRRLGVSTPEITSYILDEVKKEKPSSVHERADNLLRYLNKKTELIGSVIELRRNLADQMYGNHGAGGYGETMAVLLAWTGSQKPTEVITLAEYCDEQNWITLNAPEPTSPVGDATLYELMLKPAGYARLAELDGTNPDSTQGFIAMWFDPSMKKNQEEGFERAIENSGYRPLCINKKETINKIDDEIIAEIRRSRFVVADFTSEPDKPRGGVYYEAGFAQGLNIPVIWTCHKDNIDHVHFDTRQFNHIVWEKADDLREKLEIRIGAVIGYGPLEK
ncbi:MAG: hypothetical protein COA85_04580 [Robiginitomaculum sp.]|nr:MAG: hypothetical protein COA85_04580 [Robiginitomaculum sp.]